MAQAVARAKNLRVAPRKVRILADLIRGKRVADARNILEFSLKGAGRELGKVLESAVANAEFVATEQNQRIDTDEMVITHVMVDGGRVMRRYRPAPRGRAVRIRKRSSHVELIIADKN